MCRSCAESRIDFSPREISLRDAIRIARDSFVYIYNDEWTLLRVQLFQNAIRFTVKIAIKSDCLVSNDKANEKVRLSARAILFETDVLAMSRLASRFLAALYGYRASIGRQIDRMRVIER